MGKQLPETRSTPRFSRPRRAVSQLAIVLATLVAGARSARGDQTCEPCEPATPQTWYGWQTALADVGAVGLWSLAAVVDDAKYGSGSRENYESGSHALIFAGFAVYSFAAPAIHWAHGRGDIAKVSLGLRLGLPAAGLLTGAVIAGATCQSDDEVPCPVVGGALGLLAGGLAAVIVDAAVLSRERVTPAAGPRFQSLFVPSAGGGTLLLAGRF